MIGIFLLPQQANFWIKGYATFGLKIPSRFVNKPQHPHHASLFLTKLGRSMQHGRLRWGMTVRGETCHPRWVLLMMRMMMRMMKLRIVFLNYAKSAERLKTNLLILIWIRIKVIPLRRKDKASCCTIWLYHTTFMYIKRLKTPGDIWNTFSQKVKWNNFHSLCF